MKKQLLHFILLLLVIVLYSCSNQETNNNADIVELESKETESFEEDFSSDTITKFVYSADYELSDCVLDFLDFGRYKKDSSETYEGDLVATISYKGLNFNASKELIPEEDLANMYLADLQLLRNSIYARHGYIFKSELYKDIFNERCMGTWYEPVYENVDNELTEIEKENIKRIQVYEEFAEDYYQSFAR